VSSITFGDDSHYYARNFVPERKPGVNQDTPQERKFRQLLLAQHSNIQERVEQACKQSNNSIREYLRSETALKLSQAERRQTVPIHVVDGIPESFSKIISQVPEPIIWQLYNNRAILENTSSGLSLLKNHLPEILRFFNREASEEQKSLDSSSVFVKELLSILEGFKLSDLIREVNEDILGAYFFKIPMIQIYWMPIGIVAGILNVSVENLTFIVLAHELAHAYTHLGSDIDGVQWGTSSFSQTDLFIVEGLAQFYTQSICEKYDDRQPGVLDTFKKLLDKQPAPYTDFNSWAHDHPSEVIRFSLIFARSNNIIDYDVFRKEMYGIEKRIKGGGNNMFGKSGLF
jgi:hypothetical protein